MRMSELVEAPALFSEWAYAYDKRDDGNKRQDELASEVFRLHTPYRPSPLNTTCVVYARFCASLGKYFDAAQCVREMRQNGNFKAMRRTAHRVFEWWHAHLFLNKWTNYVKFKMIFHNYTKKIHQLDFWLIVCVDFHAVIINQLRTGRITPRSAYSIHSWFNFLF